jgi:pullulanase/glycogen debranching enzyme
LDWSDAPKVLDPYAKAAVGAKGPGIILAPHDFANSPDGFGTPKAKDLVILEMHLRDVLKNAYLPNSSVENSDLSAPSEENSDFGALEKYLAGKNCYPRILGVNCVELQPIQEFDHSNRDEYHWGYMPANWFSPASAYARDPGSASQISELRELVKAFHRAGIAVILDVVYNHFGDSGHLQNIDSAYYFRHDSSGNLTNFSGCGNDIRTESPMVRKLVVDSLVHMLMAYNVDGFRFDLAELLSGNFLDFLQKKLKKVKESVILVAEPWSFRGNIGTSMQKLPYSVWNDEYRDFARNYVLGNGNSEGLRYFLCGSLDFRSGFPEQSVNYVASHDDRCWVDGIAENGHNDGTAPTANDCRRTRLVAAILMMSVGIPMVAEGQDFLASKGGVSNTYNRGDLNALDYELLKTNRTTHEYFRKLIEFRLSEGGDVLRLESTPAKAYFRFFPSKKNSACALAYNADGTLGRNPLVFAINPHFHESEIDLRGTDLAGCRMLADGDEFFTISKTFCDKFSNGTLTLPPLSCRIYELAPNLFQFTV